MRKWLRRIHIWIGLFLCIAMINFGAAGLATAWRLTPWGGQPASERRVALEIPAGASDKQIADLVWERLDLPLSHRLSERALHRDAEDRLSFTFYTVNADYKVTVLNDAGALKVRTRPVDAANYLSRMHALTPRMENTGDWRLKVWTWFVELSIYVVLLLPLTGVYLWLARRRDDRWALASFVAGWVSFVAFYLLVR